MAVKNTELENCGPAKGGKIFILKELKDPAKVYQQESNEFNSSLIVTFTHTPGKRTLHTTQSHIRRVHLGTGTSQWLREADYVVSRG